MGPWVLGISLALLVFVILILNDLGKKRLVEEAERAGRKPRSEWRNNKTPWGFVILLVVVVAVPASTYVLFPDHPHPKQLAKTVFCCVVIAPFVFVAVWSTCRLVFGSFGAPRATSSADVPNPLDFADWDTTKAIRFEGVSTLDDVWHSMQLYRTPRRPFIPAVIVLFVLPVAIGGIVRNPAAWASYSVLGVIVVVTLVYTVFPRLQCRRMNKEQAGACAYREGIICADGIQITTASGQTALKWDGFSKCVVSDRMVLFCLASPSSFIGFSRSHFGDDDWRRFLVEVENRFPQAHVDKCSRCQQDFPIAELKHAPKLIGWVAFPIFFIPFAMLGYSLAMQEATALCCGECRPRRNFMLYLGIFCLVSMVVFVSLGRWN